MLSEWVMKGRDGGERRYGVRDEEGKFKLEQREP
jgi:hypothetical protein